MGEFVSGNYFRYLRAEAARRDALIADADDVQGAPMTAVMSYETGSRTTPATPRWWAARSWVNTKPVTITGIAPKRVLWRPADEHAAGLLSADGDDDGAGECDYVHDPDTVLAVYHWAGEAGDGDGSAAGEGEYGFVAAIVCAPGKTFKSERAKLLSGRRRTWC
jgi:hypothetical protein